MNNYFTYSVLQYKHSLVLGEVLNVGILFYFPDESRFEFVKGDGYRAKAIYPDFDNSLFNGYIRNITDKVKHHVDLFNLQSNKTDLTKYIHQHILAEDAAGLVFSNPVQVKNVIGAIEKVIKQYSGLLLPGIITEKPSVIKHNESFILRTFQGYFQDKYKQVEKKLQKNTVLKKKHFDIRFELSYNARINKFIKPLSFDLTEDSAIQTKAAVTYSHLIDLAEYAKANKSSFDFLIAPPQETGFKRDYENALDFIDSVKAPKRLVKQENWKDYTQETFELLLAN